MFNVFEAKVSFETVRLTEELCSLLRGWALKIYAQEWPGISIEDAPEAVRHFMSFFSYEDTVCLTPAERIALDDCIVEVGQDFVELESLLPNVNGKTYAEIGEYIVKVRVYEDDVILFIWSEKTMKEFCEVHGVSL